MRKILWRLVILAFFCLASLSITVVDATADTASVVPSTKNDPGVLKIVETETWDATSNSWKAISGDQRWSSERGQDSPSPSEVQPPPDYEFHGDWKIVISGSDSMGWEYVFQYLQAPKRKRVWLRSLKPKATPVLAAPKRRRSGVITRILSDMRDGYNFKGYSFRVYKSLISWESIGIGISLPLTMNFDLWDRNPALPSISSTLGFYFPWTLSAGLSASIHVEWLKWFVKTILFFVPRLLTVLFYNFVLPALWTAATTALLPLGVRIPSPPQVPDLSISKPQYKSAISERVGCSLSYRWSQRRGVEWRFNYWHSYMPTFAVFRKLLRVEVPTGWWDKHFGSLGLSTGYPLPLPPHYSCSACIGLSGLYPSSFRSRIPANEETDSRTKVSVSSALKESPINDVTSEGTTPRTEPLQQPETVKARSARLVTGTKAT